MVWGIVAVAVIVLALGAWAGAGHLGEMPEPVNDRPKPHIPDGPVDRAFVEHLRIPRVGVGYSPTQVDAYLAGFVAGPLTGEELEQSFDVVSGGYDMQAVDAVLERVAASPQAPDGVGDHSRGMSPGAGGEGPVPAEEAAPGTHAHDDQEEPGRPSAGAGVPESDAVGDNRGYDQGISKD